MSSTPPIISPDMRVGDVLTRHPAALPLLHAAGVDTCCGSALTLAEAAPRTGRSADELCRDIAQAVAGAA